jgi:alpha-glucosidase
VTAAGVPLPWTGAGDSYGFGSGHSWLPQPAGFSRTAVAAQSGRPESTLELYREALRVRRQLQTGEQLDWLPTGDPDVLYFGRPGGWHCVTNFGTAPISLPEGVVRVSSVPLTDGTLPGECTAWLTEWPKD